MISQNLTLFRRLQLLLDLGLTALAFHLTYLFRAGVPFEPLHRVIPEVLYLRTLVLILLVWLILLLLFPKAYQYRGKTAGFLAFQIGRIVTLGVSILIVLLFIFGHPARTRLTPAVFVVFDFFLLFSSRVALLKTLEHFRRKGYNYLRVLVVGSSGSARPVFERALENPHWGIKPVGFVDWDKPRWLWSYRPVPLVGLYEHLPVILTNGHIDAVLFSDFPSDPKKIRNSAEVCRKIGVTSYFLAGDLTGQNESPIISTGPTFLGWSTLQLSGPLPSSFGLAVKHAFDRLLALRTPRAHLFVAGFRPQQH